MGADRAYVVHLPGPGLVAIGAGGERAYRADINALAALLAFEMVAHVGRDDGRDAAVLNPQRPDVHHLTADAHAAVTEDAARAIKINHRRPLLLVAMLLHLHKLRFGSAV